MTFSLAVSSMLVFSPHPTSAKDRPAPCRTRSRQMTLIKNCYSGDMGHPLDAGGARFFDVIASTKAQASYCYNSLVMVDHRPSQAQIEIRVLRDGKDGQLRAFKFALAPDELRRLKSDTPLISLKGLKGDCFSPTGNADACSGGVLNLLGLRSTDVPMLLAMGKASNGQYTVSHVVSEMREPAGLKPLEIEPLAKEDTAATTERLLQEIRRKLTLSANSKLASLRSPAMTPKKMVQVSPQFRFCAMALEAYLKDKKIADPFSTQEKMVFATVTNYMNQDQLPQVPARLPASGK